MSYTTVTMSSRHGYTCETCSDEDAFIVKCAECSEYAYCLNCEFCVACDNSGNNPENVTECISCKLSDYVVDCNMHDDCVFCTDCQECSG